MINSLDILEKIKFVHEEILEKSAVFVSENSLMAHITITERGNSTKKNHGDK